MAISNHCFTVMRGSFSCGKIKRIFEISDKTCEQAFTAAHEKKSEAAREKSVSRKAKVRGTKKYFYKTNAAF